MPLAVSDNRVRPSICWPLLVAADGVLTPCHAGGIGLAHITLPSRRGPAPVGRSGDPSPMMPKANALSVRCNLRMSGIPEDAGT